MLIMFGILLVLVDLSGGIWIPIIEELPWKFLGLSSGIAGLIYTLKNGRQD